ncbi:hypothetical protein GTY75_03910 [Streptomyces sp. SID8381]|uniref:hypothetical protein n=1 Tax=unclassified Streptomyces TaxID=2593676 RepID=UPI001319FFBD|nr:MULTISPECIES: hypothetical protein [unclassified Streptomyces]MYX25823.1 hypothetical protein [Streptomyces sp. SID8381]
MSQASPKIEVRRVHELKDVAANIARDLKQRRGAGTALVISQRPAVALSVICKSWARLKREVAVDKARTLNRRRREEFDAQLTRMEWTEFTATDLEHFADVYVVEPSKATDIAPLAATIYIATPMSDLDIKKLLRKPMPEVVVIRYVTDQDALRGRGQHDT